MQNVWSDFCSIRNAVKAGIFPEHKLPPGCVDEVEIEVSVLLAFAAAGVG